MAKKKRKVAIFDIDGTIFRSSLLIELVDALILENVFDKKVRGFYIKAYKDWLNRKDTYKKYLDGVVKAFDKNLIGVRQKDFARVAKQVASFHKNRVYRYTRDLVRELKNKDYYLLAISHSPKYVVHEFAKKMGFNKVYGRIFEVSDKNRFTGRLMYPELIRDKSKVLKRAIERENLTLKGSVAVGDTESDIPLFKMVERPICFNPNSVLYKSAKKNHWQIVIERKDVIYKIKT